MTDKPTHPPMTGVESSNIEGVAHDGKDMWIRFKSGGLYRYSDVPKEAHDAFMAAPSKGGHFSKNFAGKYPHTKVQ